VLRIVFTAVQHLLGKRDGIVKEFWRHGYTVTEFYIYILSFDDLVVFAQKTFDIDFMLKRLNEHYHNSRLIIIISKTECMVNLAQYIRIL